jgi:large conductance mechanosensitive channel
MEGSMDQRQVVRRLADVKVISGFKEFLLKQNILSLAIAVVVGTALNALVKSVVDDFIMPIVGAALPSGDWQKATLDLGPVKFGIGNFAAVFINFLIVAFVAWRIAKLFIKQAEPPATKTCEFCRMSMDPAATRCPHCTSQVAAA